MGRKSFCPGYQCNWIHHGVPVWKRTRLADLFGNSGVISGVRRERGILKMRLFDHSARVDISADEILHTSQCTTVLPPTKRAQLLNPPSALQLSLYVLNTGTGAQRSTFSMLMQIHKRRQAGERKVIARCVTFKASELHETMQFAANSCFCCWCADIFWNAILAKFCSKPRLCKLFSVLNISKQVEIER